MSIYGQPLLTQGTGEMPSARFHSKTPSSATVPTFAQSQFETESSSDSDDSYEEDNSRALMPPPKLIAPSQRRASLRQATTSKSERRMSLLSHQMPLEPQPQREREREREPKSSRTSSAALSRSTSVSRRPTLVQYPKAQSANEAPRSGKIMVENSRDRRRQSYQGFDKQYRVEPDRRPKMYDADDRIVVPSHRRPQTNADMDSSSKLRDQAEGVEAYLQRTRGSETPLNDQVHRAAKRGSRIVTGPSDAGSSRSKGSDKASRVSHTTNGGGGGEIRLRVDASAPLSLQFNGDMEGRTLQINPTEDGMADIVIGGNQRGDERTYRSEKGSVLGSSKRSVVNRSDRSERPRRDPEDASTRSSRSGQSKRERELRERELRERQRDREWAAREREPEIRPLRRKPDLRYH
jgi:hypothetical protein